MQLKKYNLSRNLLKQFNQEFCRQSNIFDLKATGDIVIQVKINIL